MCAKRAAKQEKEDGGAEQPGWLSNVLEAYHNGDREVRREQAAPYTTRNHGRTDGRDARGLAIGINWTEVDQGTTLLLPSVSSYLPIIIALVVGGAVGLLIAKKIQMTAPVDTLNAYS